MGAYCVFAAGASVAYTLSAPTVMTLALTIPVPAAGSLLLALVTLQLGAFSHDGSTSTLQGRPEWLGVPQEQPWAMMNGSGKVNALASSPIRWDASEVCSMPAHNAAQGCGVPVVLRIACSLSPLALALLPSLPHFLTP